VLSTPALCVEEKLKVLLLPLTNVLISPLLKLFDPYTVLVNLTGAGKQT
jgi:hypothetical protein